MTFLDIFSNKKIQTPKKTIIVDYREKNSLVPAELKNLSLDIKFDNLKVGDYITNNIIIERKTLSDLQNSIINKRIFSQIEKLKENNSLIIIELDSQEIYMHENAIRGFLISLALDHKIQYVFSKDAKDTAKYISIISKREKNKSHSIRQSINFDSKDKQIQYILEGFPNVGPVKSKKLIAKFKSLKNIINAGDEELKTILGNKTSDFKTLLE